MGTKREAPEVLYKSRWLTGFVAIKHQKEFSEEIQKKERLKNNLSALKQTQLVAFHGATFQICHKNVTFLPKLVERYWSLWTQRSEFAWSHYRLEWAQSVFTRHLVWIFRRNCLLVPSEILSFFAQVGKNALWVLTRHICYNWSIFPSASASTICCLLKTFTRRRSRASHHLRYKIKQTLIWKKYRTNFRKRRSLSK